jgi:large subunit ribosomal protein L30
MSRLKVRLRRSAIGRPQDQKDTVRRLGLRRVNHEVLKEDRPEIRGMIEKVRHLVEVERVVEEAGKSPKGKKAG